MQTDRRQVLKGMLATLAAAGAGRAAPLLTASPQIDVRTSGEPATRRLQAVLDEVRRDYPDADLSVGCSRAFWQELTEELARNEPDRGPMDADEYSIAILVLDDGVEACQFPRQKPFDQICRGFIVSDHRRRDLCWPGV